MYLTIKLVRPHLEEPVRHPLGELSHQLVGTLVELLALSEILKMNLGVGFLLAMLGSFLAETALTVQVTEGGESLIVVGADHIIRVAVEFGTLADAFADRLALLRHDAFLAPTTDMILAGVLHLN